MNGIFTQSPLASTTCDLDAHLHHEFASFFSLKARRTFSGVMGRVLMRMPTASKIALLMTAAVGSMLSSPSPLAPNGPVGSYELAKPYLSGGMSRIEGIR